MKRILRGVGANAFGQFVTVLTQLTSVPIFLSAWGAERYGIWLMLITVPVYLGLLDFGFTGVAANRINMSVAGGQRQQAITCYESLLGLVLGLSIVFTGLSLALTAAFAPQIEGWTGMAASESLFSMAMIAVQVFGYMLAQLSYGVFWSDGRYAEAIMWHNGFRLFEFLLQVAAVLWLDAGFADLLALLAVTRVMLLGALHWRMAQFAPWARLRLSSFHRDELRALLRPALAFNAFPIGNALNMQGIVLCAGILFGPAFVAHFNAMRTLSRIPVQLGQLVSQAMSPEIGRLYGQRNTLALRRLYRHALTASSVLAALCGLALSLAGAAIIAYWTHGKLDLLEPDYSFLLIAGVINAVWGTASVMFTSTNNHARLAAIYLGANLAGLGIALCGKWLEAPVAVSLAVLATELIVLAALFPRVTGFARHGILFPRT